MKRPTRLLRRRLADKLLQAFYSACDQGAADIAQELLTLLLAHVQYPTQLPAGVERRAPQDFTGARQRLRGLLG